MLRPLSFFFFYFPGNMIKLEIFLLENCLRLIWLLIQSTALLVAMKMWYPMKRLIFLLLLDWLSLSSALFWESCLRFSLWHTASEWISKYSFLTQPELKNGYIFSFFLVWRGKFELLVLTNLALRIQELMLEILLLKLYQEQIFMQEKVLKNTEASV